MNPNALKQWVDFYMQNVAPRDNMGTHSGFNPTSFDYHPDALRFAERMAMPQPGAEAMPDNFAGLPKPPDNSQGYNRLAALMGRRF